MKNIKKLIILLFVLQLGRIYAYDYPWNVEYEIKKESLEEINEIVQEFVCANSDFHVYDLDWDAYNKNEPQGHELGIKNEYYKLDLEKKMWYLSDRFFVELFF